jgi:myo-inositol-1(or 4)-monophosphatase
MAYVASGRYDGYFQKNLKIWDIAAGVILVKEAGGIINNFSLNDIEILKVMVSSPNIGSKFQENLHNF